MGKTQTERKNEWNEKVYERINFVVKMGDKERIKAAAKDEGKSVNRFLQESIETAHPGLITIMNDESKEKKNPIE